MTTFALTSRFKVAVCAATLLTFATGASARDDGGIQGFFARAFGIDSPRQDASPNWFDPDQEDRPLVVTPRRHRITMRVAKVAKGPYVPVSIYEDATLRPGDAVMTAKGMRIFQGSRSLPYSDADFVAIAASSSVSRDVAKALTAVDRLPRG